MRMIALTLLSTLVGISALADPVPPIKREEWEEFQSQMDDISLKMAFMRDRPLAEAVIAAPDLIMKKAYQESLVNPLVLDKGVFTIKVIGTKFKGEAEKFRALKDLDLRQAAIEYAESIAVMSESLARHLLKEDPNPPALGVLIANVSQKRDAISKAFPLMENKKG